MSTDATSPTAQSSLSDIRDAGQAARDKAANKDKSALGKNEFLKLLTKQLENQDPTQPMDNTAFVAQLAQFSSLEQMNNVNDTLTQLLTAENTAMQTEAAGLVGKTALFTTDQVLLTEGSTATIGAKLSAPATEISILIKNDDGEIVRRLTPGPAPSGRNTFAWDGLDQEGDKVPSGTYQVEITATNLEGKEVALEQQGTARITGVVLNDGPPKIIAGGLTVELSDVSQVDN